MKQVLCLHFKVMCDHVFMFLILPCRQVTSFQSFTKVLTSEKNIWLMEQEHLAASFRSITPSSSVWWVSGTVQQQIWSQIKCTECISRKNPLIAESLSEAAACRAKFNSQPGDGFRGQEVKRASNQVTEREEQSRVSSQ